MKVLFSKIIAFFVSIVFLFSGVSESVIGFTDGTPIQATKHEYKFDNKGLLIGGYYATEDELKYCNDAGIQFIVASSVNEKYLDTAYSCGVGVIASNYNLPYCYMNMTDSATDRYVNIPVEQYRNHPALWGDNVIDEPVSDSYDNIQKAVSSYYGKFSGVLPFVNLFPMYANGEQLGEESGLGKLSPVLSLSSDHFLDQVDRFKRYTSDYINKIDTDYICVDIYPYGADLDKNGNMVKTTNECWLRNLDVLAEACRETGRDLWVITQAAGLTNDGSQKDMRWCEDVTDISQQAYASLAFGSKVIIHGLFGSQGWWDTDSHMIGSDGKPTKTYYAVSEVDSWLSDFAEEYGNYKYTSTYLLGKNKAAGYRHGTLACEVQAEKGGIKTNGSLLIGTFKGDSGKAYVVTNMEELQNKTSADFSFKVPAGKTATVYRQGGKVNYTSSFNMTLTPGEGVYITVK